MMRLAARVFLAAAAAALSLTGLVHAQTASPEENAEIEQVYESREFSDLGRWLFSNGHDPAFDDPRLVALMIVRVVNDPDIQALIALRDESWSSTTTARLANVETAPRQQYYNDVVRCIKGVGERIIDEGLLINGTTLPLQVAELCVPFLQAQIRSRISADCGDIEGDELAVCRADP